MILLRGCVVRWSSRTFQGQTEPENLIHFLGLMFNLYCIFSLVACNSLSVHCRIQARPCALHLKERRTNCKKEQQQKDNPTKRQTYQQSNTGNERRRRIDIQRGNAREKKTFKILVEKDNEDENLLTKNSRKCKTNRFKQTVLSYKKKHFFYKTLKCYLWTNRQTKLMKQLISHLFISSVH